MMSRGIDVPYWSWRKPVSMMCETSALISMTSPRRARGGTRISARAISDGLRAGGDGDDDVRCARPPRAVAHLRERHHGLRVGEPDARRDGRAPGARAELEARDVRLGILLVEDVDRAHVVLRAHRAIHLDRQGHGIAVLHQPRQ